ncbi:MAG: alpha/beta fold hydrolase [Candidatus Deferrimicrobium sp.]
MAFSETGSLNRQLNVFLLLGFFSAVAGCGSPFFYPTRELVPVPGLENTVRQGVRFESEDGVRLHGWLLSPRDGVSRGAILFLHGNAGNISTHIGSVLWLVDAGYTVFTFDYRGYGKSDEKEPDITGVHRDARAALKKFLSLPGISADRLVVFGQSLGAAIAVYTVATAPADRRPRALILDSPFAGYRRIVRDKLSSLVVTWPLAWPVSWFFDDEYSPERWIGKVAPVPVIVIHGTADRVVPYAHGKMLYELASDPKGIWTVEGGGHATALRNPEVRSQFLAFLASVLPPECEGRPTR